MVPAVVHGVKQLVIHVHTVAAQVVELVLPESEPRAPLSKNNLDPPLFPCTRSSTVEDQGWHSCVPEDPGGGGGGGVEVDQARADVAACLVAGVG